MKRHEYADEIKAIKLLQDRSGQISDAHSDISSDLDEIRKQLLGLGAGDLEGTEEFATRKAAVLESMGALTELRSVELSEVFAQANREYREELGITAILSRQDLAEVDEKIGQYVVDFNRRYGLDGWDYAIACSCGLLAAMLDLLCVSAPPKPTVKWQTKVDGTFNRWVQKAFNRFLPPEKSEALGKAFKIGAPDSSSTGDLLGAPAKTLNPFNHRLRSLAHDPILGFIFGVWDMMHGTCTVVQDGGITSYPTTKVPADGNVFQLLGRMLGHLLSDVNAPSAKGNRGMGLPAPLMGVLRMFEGIPLGDSNFGKQIEWMYVNGYDFRQFVVTSIPMAIMEVVLRALYVVKQMKLYGAGFGETLCDTMPLRMNPRFRIMLALAYGTSSCVNAGKVYVTQNLLNINYASWMGLAWNGFHALRWALLERHLKLWGEIESKEIAELEEVVGKVDQLSARAAALPV